MSLDDQNSDEYKEEPEEVKVPKLPPNNKPLTPEVPDITKYNSSYPLHPIELEKFWTAMPFSQPPIINDSKIKPQIVENKLFEDKNSKEPPSDKKEEVKKELNLIDIDIPIQESTHPPQINDNTAMVINPSNILEENKAIDKMPEASAFEYSPQTGMDDNSHIDASPSPINNLPEPENDEKSKKLVTLPEVKLAEPTIIIKPIDYSANIEKMNESVTVVSEDIRAIKAEAKKYKQLIEDMQIMLEAKTQVFEKNESINRDLLKRIEQLEEENKNESQINKTLRDYISNNEAQTKQCASEVQTQKRLINEMKDELHSSSTSHKKEIDALKTEIMELQKSIKSQQNTEVIKVEQKLSSPIFYQDSSSIFKGNSVPQSSVSFTPERKSMENKSDLDASKLVYDKFNSPGVSKPKHLQKAIEQQILDDKYKVCLLSNKGILYEDGVLQIGIIKEITNDTINLDVFFGNIQSELNIKLITFRPVYYDATTISLQIGEIPTLIEKKKQSKTTVQIVIKAPFLNYIVFFMEYKYNDNNRAEQELSQKCKLKLPINYLSLCHEISTEIDINSITEDITICKSEVTFALDTSRIGSIKSLKLFVTMNGRISVLPMAEKVPGRLVCGTEYNGMQGYAILSIGKNPKESLITTYSKDKLWCDVLATNILDIIAFVKPI